MIYTTNMNPRNKHSRRAAVKTLHPALQPRPLDLVWLATIAVGVAMLYVDKPKAAFDAFALGGLTLTLRLMSINQITVTIFTAISSLQVIGEVNGWYGLWPAFDKIVHILFPLIGALTLYEVLTRYGISPRLRELHNRHPRAHLFLFVFLLGVSGEAIWEMMEFASDVYHLLPTPLQHGNADTMVDLVGSAVGSVLAGITVLIIRRKK